MPNKHLEALELKGTEYLRDKSFEIHSEKIYWHFFLKNKNQPNHLMYIGKALPKSSQSSL